MSDKMIQYLRGVVAHGFERDVIIPTSTPLTMYETGYINAYYHVFHKHNTAGDKCRVIKEND